MIAWTIAGNVARIARVKQSLSHTAIWPAVAAFGMTLSLALDSAPSAARVLHLLARAGVLRVALATLWRLRWMAIASSAARDGSESPAEGQAQDGGKVPGDHAPQMECDGGAERRGDGHHDGKQLSPTRAGKEEGFDNKGEATQDQILKFSLLVVLGAIGTDLLLNQQSNGHVLGGVFS